MIILCIIIYLIIGTIYSIYTDLWGINLTKIFLFPIYILYYFLEDKLL